MSSHSIDREHSKGTGRLDESAKGVFAIAATPFDEAGAIHWPSVDSLVDFYLRSAVDGLTILGMMGEAPKLAPEEAREFVDAVLARVAGRVPVIVGVSASGFRTMSDLSGHAMQAGAAGVMIQPPTTAAKGDDSVLNYCRQSVEAIGPETPWVLQDFPLASNVPMNAALIRRIVDELPSCKMLKHEDWPGLDKLSALRGGEQPQRRISILTGNGGIFLPHELIRGADGAMTGFAYPEILVHMCRLHNSGELERMLDAFDAYLPLVRYEQQPGQGLLARKYILSKRGAMISDRIRNPGGQLSDKSRQEIDWLIARLERRLKELSLPIH